MSDDAPSPAKPDRFQPPVDSFAGVELAAREAFVSAPAVLDRRGIRLGDVRGDFEGVPMIAFDPDAATADGPVDVHAVADAIGYDHWAVDDLTWPRLRVRVADPDGVQRWWRVAQDGDFADHADADSADQGLMPPGDSPQDDPAVAHIPLANGHPEYPTWLVAQASSAGLDEAYEKGIVLADHDGHMLAHRLRILDQTLGVLDARLAAFDPAAPVRDARQHALRNAVADKAELAATQLAGADALLARLPAPREDYDGTPIVARLDPAAFRATAIGLGAFLRSVARLGVEHDGHQAAAIRTLIGDLRDQIAVLNEGWNVGGNEADAERAADGLAPASAGLGALARFVPVAEPPEPRTRAAALALARREIAAGGISQATVFDDAGGAPAVAYVFGEVPWSLDPEESQPEIVAEALLEDSGRFSEPGIKAYVETDVATVSASGMLRDDRATFRIVNAADAHGPLAVLLDRDEVAGLVGAMTAGRPQTIDESDWEQTVAAVATLVRLDAMSRLAIRSPMRARAFAEAMVGRKPDEAHPGLREFADDLRQAISAATGGEGDAHARSLAAASVAIEEGLKAHDSAHNRLVETGPGAHEPALAVAARTVQAYVAPALADWPAESIETALAYAKRRIEAGDQVLRMAQTLERAIREDLETEARAERADAHPAVRTDDDPFGLGLDDAFRKPGFSAGADTVLDRLYRRALDAETLLAVIDGVDAPGRAAALGALGVLQDGARMHGIPTEALARAIHEATAGDAPPSAIDGLRATLGDLRRTIGRRTQAQPPEGGEELDATAPRLGDPTASGQSPEIEHLRRSIAGGDADLAALVRVQGRPAFVVEASPTGALANWTSDELEALEMASAANPHPVPPELAGLFQRWSLPGVPAFVRVESPFEGEAIGLFGEEARDAAEQAACVLASRAEGLRHPVAWQDSVARRAAEDALRWARAGSVIRREDWLRADGAIDAAVGLDVAQRLAPVDPEGAARIVAQIADGDRLGESTGMSILDILRDPETRAGVSLLLDGALAAARRGLGAGTAPDRVETAPGVFETPFAALARIVGAHLKPFYEEWPADLVDARARIWNRQWCAHTEAAHAATYVRPRPAYVERADPFGLAFASPESGALAAAEQARRKAPARPDPRGLRFAIDGSACIAVPASAAAIAEAIAAHGWLEEAAARCELGYEALRIRDRDGKWWTTSTVGEPGAYALALAGTPADARRWLVPLDAPEAARVDAEYERPADASEAAAALQDAAARIEASPSTPPARLFASIELARRAGAGEARCESLRRWIEALQTGADGPQQRHALAIGMAELAADLRRATEREPPSRLDERLSTAERRLALATRDQQSGIVQRFADLAGGEKPIGAAARALLDSCVLSEFAARLALVHPAASRKLAFEAVIGLDIGDRTPSLHALFSQSSSRNLVETEPGVFSDPLEVLRRMLHAAAAEALRDCSKADVASAVHACATLLAAEFPDALDRPLPRAHEDRSAQPAFSAGGEATANVHVRMWTDRSPAADGLGAAIDGIAIRFGGRRDSPWDVAPDDATGVHAGRRSEAVYRYPDAPSAQAAQRALFEYANPATRPGGILSFSATVGYAVGAWLEPDRRARLTAMLALDWQAAEDLPDAVARLATLPAADAIEAGADGAARARMNKPVWIETLDFHRPGFAADVRRWRGTLPAAQARIFETDARMRAVAGIAASDPEPGWLAQALRSSISCAAAGCSDEAGVQDAVARSLAMLWRARFVEIGLSADLGGQPEMAGFAASAVAALDAAYGAPDALGLEPQPEAAPDFTQFFSGLSRIKDMLPAAATVGGMASRGIGVDACELSEQGIETLAQRIVDQKCRAFVDSGAFQAFRAVARMRREAGEELFEPGDLRPAVDFDAVLDRYDRLLDAIARHNPAEEDVPPPLLVMPDIVGDQRASLDLLRRHRDWIAAQAQFPRLAGIVVPIQRGEMSLAQAWREAAAIVGTENFTVGLPSNEKAVPLDELRRFLAEARPQAIHFLGLAAPAAVAARIQAVQDAGLGAIPISADANVLRTPLYGTARGDARADAIVEILSGRLGAEGAASALRFRAGTRVKEPTDPSRPPLPKARLKQRYASAMGGSGTAADIGKALQALAGHRSAAEVFRAWVETLAIASGARTEKTAKAKTTAEFEKAARAAIAARVRAFTGPKASKAEIERVRQVFADMGRHFGEELSATRRDVLGRIFMAMDWGNSYTGQFFTPDDIAGLMSEISTIDAAAAWKARPRDPGERPFYYMQEPACGAGVMLLANAHALEKQGFKPTEYLFDGIELDDLTARMAFVQCAVAGIPARIWRGNALGDPSQWTCIGVTPNGYRLASAHPDFIAAVREGKQKFHPAEMEVDAVAANPPFGKQVRFASGTQPIARFKPLIRAHAELLRYTHDRADGTYGADLLVDGARQVFAGYADLDALREDLRARLPGIRFSAGRETPEDPEAARDAGWHVDMLAPGVATGARPGGRDAAGLAWRREAAAAARRLLPQEADLGLVVICDALWIDAAWRRPAAARDWRVLGGATVPVTHPTAGPRHAVVLACDTTVDPRALLAHEAFHANLREGRLAPDEIDAIEKGAAAYADLATDPWQLAAYPGGWFVEEFGAHLWQAAERHRLPEIGPADGGLEARRQSGSRAAGSAEPPTAGPGRGRLGSGPDGNAETGRGQPALALSAGAEAPAAPFQPAFDPGLAEAFGVGPDSFDLEAPGRRGSSGPSRIRWILLIGRDPADPSAGIPFVPQDLAYSAGQPNGVSPLAPFQRRHDAEGPWFGEIEPNVPARTARARLVVDWTRPMREAVDRIGFDVAPAAQWAGTIANLTGIPADLRTWIGLEAALRQLDPATRLTRPEILDFISGCEPTLSVQVALQDSAHAAAAARWIQLEPGEPGYFASFDHLRDGARTRRATAYVWAEATTGALVAQTQPEPEAPAGVYVHVGWMPLEPGITPESAYPIHRTLDGAQHAAIREAVISSVTEPPDPAWPAAVPGLFDTDDSEEAARRVQASLRPVYGAYRQPGEIDGYGEVVFFNAAPHSWHSRHWTLPNPWLHVRFTRRGGILGIEEIQSDLHEAARAAGYAGTTAAGAADADPFDADPPVGSRPPLMPFAAHWAEFGLETALRQMAAGGQHALQLPGGADIARAIGAYLPVLSVRWHAEKQPGEADPAIDLDILSGVPMLVTAAAAESDESGADEITLRVPLSRLAAHFIEAGGRPARFLADQIGAAVAAGRREGTLTFDGHEARSNRRAELFVANPGLVRLYDGHLRRVLARRAAELGADFHIDETGAAVADAFPESALEALREPLRFSAGEEPVLVPRALGAGVTVFDRADGSTDRPPPAGLAAAAEAARIAPFAETGFCEWAGDRDGTGPDYVLTVATDVTEAASDGRVPPGFRMAIARGRAALDFTGTETMIAARAAAFALLYYSGRITTLESAALAEIALSDDWMRHAGSQDIDPVSPELWGLGFAYWRDAPADGPVAHEGPVVTGPADIVPDPAAGRLDQGRTREERDQTADLDARARVERLFAAAASGEAAHRLDDPVLCRSRLAALGYPVDGYRFSAGLEPVAIGADLSGYDLPRATDEVADEPPALVTALAELDRIAPFAKVVVADYLGYDGVPDAGRVAEIDVVAPVPDAAGPADLRIGLSRAAADADATGQAFLTATRVAGFLANYLSGRFSIRDLVDLEEAATADDWKAFTGNAPLGTQFERMHVAAHRFAAWVDDAAGSLGTPPVWGGSPAGARRDADGDRPDAGDPRRAPRDRLTPEARRLFEDIDLGRCALRLDDPVLSRARLDRAGVPVELYRFSAGAEHGAAPSLADTWGHSAAGDSVARSTPRERPADAPETRRLFHGTLTAGTVPGAGTHLGTRAAAEARLRDFIEARAAPPFYAPAQAEWKPEIVEVELSAKKTFEMKDGLWDGDHFVRAIEEAGIADETEMARLRRYDIDGEEFLAAKGYEAVRYRNTNEDPGSESWFALGAGAVRVVGREPVAFAASIAREDAIADSFRREWVPAPRPAGSAMLEVGRGRIVLRIADFAPMEIAVEADGARLLRSWKPGTDRAERAWRRAVERTLAGIGGRRSPDEIGAIAGDRTGSVADRRPDGSFLVRDGASSLHVDAAGKTIARTGESPRLRKLERDLARTPRIPPSSFLLNLRDVASAMRLGTEDLGIRASAAEIFRREMAAAAPVRTQAAPPRRAPASQPAPRPAAVAKPERPQPAARPQPAVDVPAAAPPPPQMPTPARRRSSGLEL